jgi:hypothetical protein
MADAMPFRDGALGGIDPGMCPPKADHLALAQEVVDVSPSLPGEPRVPRLARNVARSATEQGKPTAGRFRPPRAGHTRHFHQRASVNDSMVPRKAIDTCGRQRYNTALKRVMKDGFIYELSTEVNELSTQVRALLIYAHDRRTPAHERPRQLPSGRRS